MLEGSFLLSNEELDEILGPIDAGTVILVEGFPGTGKTTFALSTAYRNAVEREFKVLYLTLGETPSKLLKKAQLLGLEEIEHIVSQGAVQNCSNTRDPRSLSHRVPNEYHIQRRDYARIQNCCGGQRNSDTKVLRLLRYATGMASDRGLRLP